MAEPGRSRSLCRFFTYPSQLVRAGLAFLGEERRCPACSSVFKPEARGESGLFCPSCTAALGRRELGYCPLCGELAAWPALPLAPCRRCLEARPSWQGFCFHGPHEGLLRQLLIRLKFREQTVLAHSLGLLLGSHPFFLEAAVDAVVPVPLHTARLSRRGYNQALELARSLCLSLRRPLEPNLLTRTKHTVPQTGIRGAERRKNTLGAFAGAQGARGKHILLLDDTLTTGATAESAAVALLEAGALSVSVAVMSRTAKHYATSAPRA